MKIAANNLGKDRNAAFFRLYMLGIMGDEGQK